MSDKKRGTKNMDVFEPLKRRDQWLLWKELPSTDKPRKVPHDMRDPLNPTPHDPHDRAIHMNYDLALLLLESMSDPLFHLGFVLTEDDPFFCLDLDSCFSDDNNLYHWASPILAQFPGASIEVSHSGKGLHVWGACGPLPARKMRCNDLELYTDKRFMAFTGVPYGQPVHHCETDWTTSVLRIVEYYLRANPHDQVPISDVDWTSEGVPGSLTDTGEIKKILMRMGTLKALMQNNPIDGSEPSTYRATAADLFNGNIDALSRAYPSSNGGEYNASGADQALANHLVFLTGGNCELTKDLMFESALVRDKWDRDDYITSTIKKAVAATTDFYKKPQSDSVVMPLPPSVTGVPMPLSPGVAGVPMPPTTQPTPGVCALLPITAQLEHFKDCVYIIDRHRILMPNGTLIKPEVFQAVKGGSTFMIAAEKTTPNAFKAFTENQLHDFPSVDTTCFRPDLPVREIIKIDNLRAINTFVPLYGKQIEGDISLFMNHLSLLLPYKSDQETFLDWLAWVIQNPGKKAQWAVVLQGVQGNGKTVFYHLLEYALGKRYCHQVNPADLGNVFTGWVEDKLLACIEEIHTGGKRKISDSLKPLITNRRAPIQQKGVDQRTGDNCANFILFSNHKDAVLKTANDRRYCVFYSLQQDIEGLELCGMDDAYFILLYNWLETEGYAHVSHMLARREVKTNVLGRAPLTTSTAEAIKESAGFIEQLISDAIENDEPGFTDGLLLPGAVNDYIMAHPLARSLKYSPNGILKKISNLGYRIHPAFVVDHSRGLLLRLDVGKWRRQRFYIMRGNPLEAIDTPMMVAEKWLAMRDKRQREQMEPIMTDSTITAIMPKA